MAGFLSNMFGKKSSEEDKQEYYLENPNAPEITERQRFGLLLGLILGEINGLYTNSLQTGRKGFGESDVMRESWGINNREDAIRFLDARSGEEGHRFIFDPLLKIYLAQKEAGIDNINFSGTIFENNRQDAIDYLKNLEEVLEIDDYWFDDGDEELEVGTAAWDIGRIVYVVRTCYSLGYISESEAWNYIGKIADLASKTFEDWLDYAQSYILGRAMWGGADEDGWENNSEFAIDALENEDSPWVEMDWQK